MITFSFILIRSFQFFSFFRSLIQKLLNHRSNIFIFSVSYNFPWNFSSCFRFFTPYSPLLSCLFSFYTLFDRTTLQFVCKFLNVNLTFFRCRLFGVILQIQFTEKKLLFKENQTILWFWLSEENGIKLRCGSSN